MCVLSVSGEQVAAARQLLPEYHVCTTNEMQNLARSKAIYYSILLAITFAKEIHVIMYVFFGLSVRLCAHVYSRCFGHIFMKMLGRIGLGTTFWE